MLNVNTGLETPHTLTGVVILALAAVPNVNTLC